jgi:hypothetical protein
MAFRKETIKRQFAEAQTDVLEPGEGVQAASLTTSGLSPWLIAALGWLIMLLLGMRYYFVLVTDRRVVFMKASLLSGRPKGLAFADSRDQVSIIDVKFAGLWSSLRYRRPDGKELRLNFHRFWRDEMRALVQVLAPDLPPPPPVDET